MVEFQSIKEKVKRRMVGVPEEIQIPLVQYEYQAENFHVCRFVLPNIHECYRPVSEVHAPVLLNEHADDVVRCLSSRARYPTHDMFCFAQLGIHNSRPVARIPYWDYLLEPL